MEIVFAVFVVLGLFAPSGAKPPLTALQAMYALAVYTGPMIASGLLVLAAMRWRRSADWMLSAISGGVLFLVAGVVWLFLHGAMAR